MNGYVLQHISLRIILRPQPGESGSITSVALPT
jgi:hypothetical protein